MSGPARRREFALVRAVGGTHPIIITTAVWEAVIYAATATVLATAATVAGGVILAGVLGLPGPVVALAPIALVGGGGLVLILVATVVPTLTALRHEIPRVLAVE